jgi:hypothetical protein
VVRGSVKRAFEIKRTTTPRISRSIRSALEDLDPDWIDLIHAGRHTFMLDEKVRALSADFILQEIEPLS